MVMLAEGDEEVDYTYLKELIILQKLLKDHEITIATQKEEIAYLNQMREKALDHCCAEISKQMKEIWKL